MSARTTRKPSRDAASKPSATWRVWLVVAVAGACLSCAAFTLWREDLRYSLPTPRPPDLKLMPLGAIVPLADWLGSSAVVSGERPRLLHFFNPACSCSRFNLTHLRELRDHFRGKVDFLAVVQSVDSNQELAARLASLDLEMPHVVDRDGRIAREAGIYSTPQALLLDRHARILYRGNYNLSRYCTDPRTEFVRIAIERELSAQPISLPQTLAYGCELPGAASRRQP
ncbi:MAG: hypothetical protein QM778_30005 [Myxococcales bacterium]